MINPATYSDTQYIDLETGKGTTVEPGSTPEPTTPTQLKDAVSDPIPQAADGIKKNFIHDTLEWDGLLFEGRERPYVDIQLYPDANKIRLPIAVNEYDLFVDTGKFYEDVSIDGSVSIGGGVAGDLNITGELTYLRAIEIVTQNKTISMDDKSKIIHVEPDAASVTLTLPSSGIIKGFSFDVVNSKQGAFTVIKTEAGTLKAKHPGLSQAYSSATVYWTGSDWFAIGDLTPIA